MKKPNKKSAKSHSKYPPTKKKKPAYRITNWQEYNAALVSRGSVTVWLGNDDREGWYSDPGGNVGHPKLYSDIAIEAVLTIREVYKLPLRATEGFVSSLLAIMGAGIKAPDYSTLSYRAKTLKINLSREAKAALERGEAVHIAVDSTGVKVYGEGEWKVRKHGWSKHRSWMKIHLGVVTEGPAKHIIPMSEMTANGEGDGDGQTLPTLLKQLFEIFPNIFLAKFFGDGGYDTRDCYEALSELGAEAVIPPQKNARIWKHGNSKEEKLQRDQHLRRIRKVGRKIWKQEIGYHARSLSETAMFRLKTLTSDTLSNRRFDTQKTQVKARIQALNTMTLLGMPVSMRVVTSPSG